MADYTRKQIDVDGSYIFPYTHADAVLYTTQNNLDGITSGTETNVKAVLDALDNTYRRLDSNITSLYNSQGKRGFLYLNGTTTTASMELPTQGNDFYVPTLKYDSNGNITTAWQTPANIAAAADLSGYLPLTGGTLTGALTVNADITTTGKVMVGTGGIYSLLASSSATNIYLLNSSGAVLVCDAKVVRRGTSLTDIDLGSSTYPWRALYANTIYENGTSLASKYVTLATDLSITGEKTFTGNKRIKFKLSTSSDKLGFTLYNSSNVEVGFFEWEASSINAKSALTLGLWVSTDIPATPGYLGFKVVDVTTAARYALVTPLLADAKTPLSLNNALKLFYFPLLFKNGTNTVTTANTGVVDLSTLMPTANVSTSAVIASSSSSTTQITATQSDPYYNLIEGSTVARSIRFVAGTGISISAATNGQITITNTDRGSSTMVSSILASSSSGTTAITGDTLNPYYNLLVNSAVSSSVQFKAGTNISVTGDSNNGITFSNTLTNMSQLTNNLFVNGTQTTLTSNWTGNLPAGITLLYDGLTIFYRLSLTCSSSGVSLLLYDSTGTTTIGSNCPVYAGGTIRLSNHYGAGSIVRLTYYNGEWRTNPYYYTNTNNMVSQNNVTSDDYRALILGYLTSATASGLSTSNVTNYGYKSSGLVYSPGLGKLYIENSTANELHGLIVSNTSVSIGLVTGTDNASIGIRDIVNDKWLCYCDDVNGDSLKVPGTLIPQVINLAEHCLIAYDSTNQCINFTFT